MLCSIVVHPTWDNSPKRWSQPEISRDTGCLGAFSGEEVELMGMRNHEALLLDKSGWCCPIGRSCKKRINWLTSFDLSLLGRFYNPTSCLLVWLETKKRSSSFIEPVIMNYLDVEIYVFIASIAIFCIFWDKAHGFIIFEPLLGIFLDSFLHGHIFWSS